jgi:hypothetical protein
MRALTPKKVRTSSSVSASVRNLGKTLGVSLSSILLTFQLQSAGYTGPVIGAPPAFLVASISTIMIAGAGFCFIGAVASLLGSTGARKTSERINEGLIEEMRLELGRFFISLFLPVRFRTSGR